MVIAAMKLKNVYSLEGKLWPTWQHIQKQRHYFANKCPSSQGYGFSSSHVWMWELDYKESWTPKNWYFWTVVLEKTLESPLDCRRSNQSILKQISPGCLLEGLMLKLKLQYFGQLMGRADSFEKTLILGCNLKNDRMISVRLQGKPFNIIVIQVSAQTSNTEEAEVERFYEDLQDLLELTPEKDVLFIIGDWNAKVESRETPGVIGKFGLECGMKQGKD